MYQKSSLFHQNELKQRKIVDIFDDQVVKTISIFEKYNKNQFIILIKH